MKKTLLLIVISFLILSSCSLIDSNLYPDNASRIPNANTNSGNSYGLGNGNAFGLSNGNGHSYGWGNKPSEVEIIIPVFYNFTSSRRISLTQDENNNSLFFLLMPPITRWETQTIPSTQTSIVFDIFNISLECTITLQDNAVHYSGANDSIILELTIYDDQSFDYHSFVITEVIDSNPEIPYIDVFEVETQGMINTDFFIGDVTAYCWEVSPAGAHGDNDNESSVIKAKLTVSSDTSGIPVIEIISFEEIFDSTLFMDPAAITLSDYDRNKIIDIFNREETIP